MTNPKAELRKKIEAKLSVKLVAHTPLGDTEILNAAPIAQAILSAVDEYVAEVSKHTAEARMDEIVRAAQVYGFAFRKGRPYKRTEDNPEIVEKYFPVRYKELERQRGGLDT